MQFIDLAAQYQSLKNRIDERIQTVLDNGQYIMGPEVHELEQRLADYVGVKHVVTCANGTDALQLALIALGIKQGDAVFCPTFTFFASAEAISFVGATPVFVDVEASTFNISPTDLETKIKAVRAEGKLKPKAIMAVDLFGLPADFPKLQVIANAHGLSVIEDAAQGFGGSIDGQRACSFGDVATTSFFPAKPLGCYGDGGALFTNDDGFAEMVRSLRIHGKGQDKYDNVRIGMNSRLDTLQASVLLEKLVHFDEELSRKQALAEFYSDTLSDCMEIPSVSEGFKSAWAQFTVKLMGRDRVAEHLREKQIPTAVYYAKCLHRQPVYADARKWVGSFPNADKLAGSVLSLPMHAYLDRTSAQRVVNSLRESVAKI